MPHHQHPLDIAIVGSGPSGFFSAEYLLRLARPCRVTMFERWPTPHGLVRGAIAPDHMHIRRVTRAFDRVAAQEGFCYFGNVLVGRDISVDDLRALFHVVVITTGAQRSLRPAVPGADLPGCHGAAEVAGWYNGRPDCAALPLRLTGAAAVIVGAGNVALDMARMLSWPPESLAATDISGPALERLAQSEIRDLHIVARRGPLQARFTPQELRLLKNIPGCAVYVHGDALSSSMQPATESEDALMRAYTYIQSATNDFEHARRRIHFHFNLTPEAFLGAEMVTGALFRDPCDTPLHIPAQLVIAAIGQTGEVLPGLPFDPGSGAIPHQAGRVLHAGETLHGYYVAGWIKRGATGVIGTNKPDCRETVQSILDDQHILPRDARGGAAAVRELLARRGVRYVDYAEWLRLDAEELRRGALLGKAREPFHCVAAMLEALDQARPQVRP